MSILQSGQRIESALPFAPGFPDTHDASQFHFTANTAVTHPASHEMLPASGWAHHLVPRNGVAICDEERRHQAIEALDKPRDASAPPLPLLRCHRAKPQMWPLAAPRWLRIIQPPAEGITCPPRKFTNSKSEPEKTTGLQVRRKKWDFIMAISGAKRSW